MFSQIGPTRQFNQNFLTFNSLNSFILKGDAAQGMELTFATLMARCRRRARRHVRAGGARRCGARPTASPIVSSSGPKPNSTTARGSPRTTSPSRSTSSRRRATRSSRQSLRDFDRRRGRRRRQRRGDASRRSARATCRCSSPACRSSRAPITRPSRSTNRRSTSRSAPAPTRSAASRPAASSNIERVADWWGADLPVTRGQNNFDIVRFEFYRDRDVGFEGFTAKNYLFREEFTSRTWATRYDFPGVQGRPRQARRSCPTRRRPARRAGSSTRGGRNSPIRGCARRSSYAFDFEWTNKKHHVRLLRAHRLGVPELRHDGAGQARRRRARAARAVPRPRAGRGVRRAVCAAGVRRLRPGPRAAAQGLAAAARTPAARSRTASACCRTASRSPSSS